MYNGSYSQHAVSDEGVLVTGTGGAAWEQLNIRQAPDTALPSCVLHYQMQGKEFKEFKPSQELCAQATDTK